MSILIERLFTSLFILMFFATVAYTQTKYERATFAGGCFWCIQPPFEKLNGVIKVVSGYTGGKGINPTYEDYAQKGHIEAVEITYDPSKITYAELLDVFWRQIDPTDPGGQFCDRGPQYRSAIFYHNEEQRNLAEKSKLELEKSARFKKAIVTEMIKASTFYAAEEYHQDYHKKNPVRYKFYRFNCGRDQYLKKIWGNEMAKEELKNKLTALQYKVTQENGTEPAFHNEYWDNKKDGISTLILSLESRYSVLKTNLNLKKR